MTPDKLKETANHLLDHFKSVGHTGGCLCEPCRLARGVLAYLAEQVAEQTHEND